MDLDLDSVDFASIGSDIDIADYEHRVVGIDRTERGGSFAITIRTG